MPIRLPLIQLPAPMAVFPADPPARREQGRISPDRLNHPVPGAQYNLMAEYSYLVLYLPRGMTPDAARRILTDHAEYGDWELARLRLNADGSRKATLRRQIIRSVRTL